MYIHKTDGTHLSLRSVATGIALKSGEQVQTLLGEDRLSLTIESIRPIDWQIGDKLDAYGKTYKLNRLPNMLKTASNAYSYSLEMESLQYDLARVHYDTNVTSLKPYDKLRGDTITGDLARFAEVLHLNLERIFPGSWVLGQMLADTEAKTLSFAETESNCLAVLQRLCKEYKCEYRISSTTDNKQRIDFVPEGKGEQFPTLFAVGMGKGLYRLERKHLDSSNIITRLKVYGSSDNLGRDYRDEVLCLPGREHATSYIEDEALIRKYGVWEAVKIFDEIKPSRTGVVSSVVEDKPLVFVDEEMYDLMERDETGAKRYIVASETPKIAFIRGALVGYEFDISGYEHSSKTLSIKPRKLEGLSELIPSSKYPALSIQPGDKYKLINVALPPRWTDEAERKLEQEGRAYYEQNSQPRASYTLEISEAYLVEHYGSGAVPNLFAVGDYLHIQDHEVGIDKSVRIMSIRRDILSPFAYKITLADKVQVSYIQRVIEEQIQQTRHIEEVRQEGATYTDRRFAEVQQTTEGLVAAMGDRFGGAINPVAVHTMQLLAGDERLQFVFVNNATERQAKPLPIEWLANSKSLRIAGQQYLMHYTLPDKVLGSAIHTERLKLWTLPAYQSPAIEQSDKPYYLYAMVEREGERGTFRISTDRLEDSPNEYALLVGMLSSADEDGERSFVALHGFSEILPGRITTDRIVSSSGVSYFDLLTGQINGKITITNEQGKALLGGSTTIDGGLLLSSIIGAVDASGKLRSYISGDHSKSAFVAGLSDDQSTSNVWIRHSGDAKFGKLYVDASGIIRFKHSEGDSEHYMRIGGGLTPLARLQSASADQGEERIRLGLSYQGRNYQGHIHETIQPAQGRIRPSLPNGRLQLQGTITLTQSDSAIDDSPEWRGRERLRDSLQGASILLYLEDETGQRRIIDSLFIEPLVGQNHHSETLRLDHSLDYTSEKSLTLTLDLIAGATPTSSLELSSDLKLRYSAYSDTKEIAFGKEGMSLFFGYDRYLYAQRTGEPFLSIAGTVQHQGDMSLRGKLKHRGAVDMFGVLATGRCEQDGRIVFKGGHYAEGLSITRGADSRYILRHNLGHQRYTISLMTIGRKDVPSIYAIRDNEIEFAFGIEGYNYTSPFFFTLMGEPRQI